MKRIVIIIRTCIFLSLLVGSIILVTRFFEPKRQSYYQEKQWDVVFFGTSEAYCTFNPAVFGEYGLKTYNKGMPEQTMGMTYFYVKEALKQAEIDTVVLEIYGMFFEEDMYENMEEAEASLNVMPYSLTKLEAVRELMPKNSWAGYVFPLDKYHGDWEKKKYSSWKEFGDDFAHRYYVDASAGYVGSEDVSPFEYPGIDVRMNDERWDIYSKNMDYLEKIYQLCEKKGTRLILVKAPVPCYLYMVQFTNSIEDWANGHDVEFVDYMRLAEEIGLNPETDSMDGGGHLNTLGANKVSESMVKYLLQMEDD